MQIHQDLGEQEGDHRRPCWCVLLCLGSSETRSVPCPRRVPGWGVGSSPWRVGIYLGRRAVAPLTWHRLALGPRPKQGSLEVAGGPGGSRGAPTDREGVVGTLGPEVQTEQMDKGVCPGRGCRLVMKGGRLAQAALAER